MTSTLRPYGVFLKLLYGHAGGGERAALSHELLVHDFAGGGGRSRIAICEKRCYDTGAGEQLYEHRQSD